VVLNSIKLVTCKCTRTDEVLFLCQKLTTSVLFDEALPESHGVGSGFFDSRCSIWSASVTV